MGGGSLFSRTAWEKSLRKLDENETRKKEKEYRPKAVIAMTPREILRANTYVPSCFIFVSAHRARFEARNLYFKAIKRAYATRTYTPGPRSVVN